MSAIGASRYSVSTGRLDRPRQRFAGARRHLSRSILARTGNSSMQRTPTGCLICIWTRRGYVCISCSTTTPRPVTRNICFPPLWWKNIRDSICRNDWAVGLCRKRNQTMCEQMKRFARLRAHIRISWKAMFTSCATLAGIIYSDQYRRVYVLDYRLQL